MNNEDAFKQFKELGVKPTKEYKKAIGILQSIRGWNAVTNINNLVTKVKASK